MVDVRMPQLSFHVIPVSGSHKPYINIYHVLLQVSAVSAVENVTNPHIPPHLCLHQLHLGLLK